MTAPRTSRLQSIASGISPVFSAWVANRRAAFDKFELLVLRGYLAGIRHFSAESVAKAVRAFGITVNNSMIRSMARLFVRCWPQCVGVFVFKRGAV